MLAQHICRLLALAAITGLAACSSYDVTVNERRVFNTAPLYTDFEIADEALHNCVTETIASQRISSASQLKELNCRELGIVNLSGIGTFTGLETVRLSNNNIRDIEPLKPLSSLQVLYLDHNQVVDPVPLYDLMSLRVLDINRNGDLKCPSSLSLLRAQEISLPRHCR